MQIVWTGEEPSEQCAFHSSGVECEIFQTCTKKVGVTANDLQRTRERSLQRNQTHTCKTACHPRSSLWAIILLPGVKAVSVIFTERPTTQLPVMICNGALWQKRKRLAQLGFARFWWCILPLAPLEPFTGQYIFGKWITRDVSRNQIRALALGTGWGLEPQLETRDENTRQVHWWANPPEAFWQHFVLTSDPSSALEVNMLAGALGEVGDLVWPCSTLTGNGMRYRAGLVITCAEGEQ